MPSFTHNWLARNNPGRLPKAFRCGGARRQCGGPHFMDRDSPIHLFSRIVDDRRIVAGNSLSASGRRSCLRRSSGPCSTYCLCFRAHRFPSVGRGDPVAPLFGRSVPVLHGWTTGAVGLMTLAVMTRATLGHTARGLVASISTSADLPLCPLRRACTDHRGFRAVGRPA